MTTKPSPLRDIRYFETTAVAEAGQPAESGACGRFGLPRNAHRLGQRIACLLEAERFSIGRATHLYVMLTGALQPGEIVSVGPGFDMWQHYVACGLPSTFPARAPHEKCMHLQALTFDALRAVTTGSQEGLLSTVRARLDAGGAATRVLRAVKQTAAYRVEIWFDVPDLDQQAHLHVVANDLRSGAVLDAPPFPLEDYEHAFPLVARIGASKGVVTIAPRDSWLAAGRTRKYPNPLRLAIANFRVRGDAAAPP